jgi:porin
MSLPSPTIRRTGICALLAGLVIVSSHPAFASAPSINMQVDADSYDTSSGGSNFGYLSGVSRSQTLMGDMGGIRPWLAQYGWSFNMLETSEVLGNVSGGYRKSFDYDGLTQFSTQMDTQRAFGWYGGTFNASALDVHGDNLSTNNLGTLQTASGIEAHPGARLWELWYQQKFLDEDRLDVKIGQQSLDQEFMGSANANTFVNTMFGWPMVPSADLPGGGPAYPLSALGVRVRGRPNDSITVLGGVFNGSPTNKTGQNYTGAGFPLDGGTLAIAEVQFAYPSLGSMVSPDSSGELSGTYKLGVWYDSQNFNDLGRDTSGLSLADSNTNGNALQHHGNYGLYAVADQMLWHSENFEDRTLNFFTRVMGTPQTDRNLIDFSLNAGFTLHEPLPLRDNDTVGIGVGYADVSSRAVALDQDTAAANPSTYQPIRSGETFIEATYQYQVTPWWQVQPDLQYVFNPGAGAANPNNGAERIGNEAVIGIRTNIQF